ncbi:MAG: NAD(P)-dependent dehydrogenase (short-subunit alcohol dehydrogenase family) [Planctomycetaceae bacterium]|jgi:NAD(P)-dependent dehydrogenase (short-subunit alcohol dehydrogenase family)
MTRQTIFITGAASGIGRATAIQFHQRGWFVGATDVDEAGLISLSEECHNDCFTSHLDVADKDAYDKVIKEFAIHAGDRLDILFNNAGIAIFGTIADIPFQKIIDTVNVNFIGVLNGVHAAMDLIQRTPNSLCFTTASSAASFGTAGLATYSATKAAVKNLTEALSVELARHDSRAADVSPGIIDTPLWDTTRHSKGQEKPAMNLARANQGRTDASRTLSANEVADSVWEAYTGDGLHYYVPPEVADREKAKVANPEKLRDELIRSRKK